MNAVNPQANAQAAAAANLQARGLVLARGVDMWQQVFTHSYTTGNILGAVIPIQLRNVGLVKRLLVKISMTVARSASETHTRTPLGPANVLSNVTLTDLSNNLRVNTAGWHLFMLSTVRRQIMRGYGMAYGAAFTNDSPVDIGSNFSVITCPSSFTTGNQTIEVYYEIPVSYSDFDLRGAIFANIVNATFQLQLTVNQNLSVANTADETLAVFQSSSSDLAVPSAMTVTVYQNYLDQLPQGPRGPILPIEDLSRAYILTNTVGTGMSANQDFTVTYANFRDFYSTFAIYDQNGVTNVGTDINYWALRSANFTNIFQIDPITATLLNSRLMFNDDPPAGMYYFDHRARPISTAQYGNMELVLNPITAAAQSSLLIGFEQMAIQNLVVQGGSLYNT